MDILDRFLNYVSIDTTSDSLLEETPSSDGQIKLARLLVSELKQMGLSDVYFDDKHCYVYGKLNGDPELVKIGFVAHLDTSEAASGKDIKPNIIHNYSGEDIILKDIVIKPSAYPDLKNHIGKTIITTDGTTLLGADDKAGIAVIMDMLQYFLNSKEEHGDIFVCFTPDEEIGLGTLHFDKNYFNPDFAYTVDGCDLGEFSYENFNAASAVITINGVACHPGSAKGVMVNAVRISTIINSLLPEEIPENTENYEGFFHLEEINGDITNTTMKYIIRDFDKENFEKRKELLVSIVSSLNEKYNNCINLEIKDSYRNMLEVIQKESNMIDKTKKAVISVGVEPKVLPIRGGTDGTEISFLGIPCPNLGTGSHNFHSVYEYVCLEDMKKTSEILVSIVKEFSK